MNDSEKVEAMCQERNGLRLEIIDLGNGLRQAIFAFIAIAGVIASVYWEDSLVEDEAARLALLVGLSQVEFLLAMFALSGVPGVNVKKTSLSGNHLSYKRIFPLSGDLQRGVFGDTSAL